MKQRKWERTMKPSPIQQLISIVSKNFYFQRLSGKVVTPQKIHFSSSWCIMGTCKVLRHGEVVLTRLMLMRKAYFKNNRLICRR